MRVGFVESMERVHNYEVFVVVMLVQRIRCKMIYQIMNDAIDVTDVVFGVAMSEL
jgi:hypothetical protein